MLNASPPELKMLAVAVVPKAPPVRTEPRCHSRPR